MPFDYNELLSRLSVTNLRLRWSFWNSSGVKIPREIATADIISNKSMYNPKTIGWIQKPVGLKLSGNGSIPPPHGLRLVQIVFSEVRSIPAMCNSL